MKTFKDDIVDMVIKDDKRGSMMSYFWESKNDKVYRVEFQKKDTRD
jgi:hypothetical protein